jgi:hypothetical protein
VRLSRSSRRALAARARARPHPRAGWSFVPYAVVFCLAILLGHHFNKLLGLGLEKEIFLDKACVPQDDPVAKAAGIANLGDVIGRSKRALVLWGPDYFERVRARAPFRRRRRARSRRAATDQAAVQAARRTPSGRASASIDRASRPRSRNRPLTPLVRAPARIPPLSVLCAGSCGPTLSSPASSQTTASTRSTSCRSSSRSSSSRNMLGYLVSLAFLGALVQAEFSFDVPGANSFLVVLCIGYLPGGMIVGAFHATSILDRRDMMLQVEAFDAAQAHCFCCDCNHTAPELGFERMACDRLFVNGEVRKLYADGGDGFTAHVRDNVPRHLRKLLGTAAFPVPLYAFAMCFGTYAWVGIDVAINSSTTFIRAANAVQCTAGIVVILSASSATGVVLLLLTHLTKLTSRRGTGCARSARSCTRSSTSTSGSCGTASSKTRRRRPACTSASSAGCCSLTRCSTASAPCSGAGTGWGTILRIQSDHRS